MLGIFYPEYAEGMSEAGPALEAAGVRQIFGPNGKYQTWQEIRDYYASRTSLE